LYSDKIDYSFPSGDGEFTGTSRAVAEALAKAINMCPINEMRICLKKNAKVFVDKISGTKVLTF
jgi:hypothetical protein